MEDWYYKFVDLPPVPENLIQDSYESIKNDDIDGKFPWYAKSGQEIDYVNGKQKNSVGFIQFNIPDHVTAWFKENIVERGDSSIKISANTPGDHKGAHTDKTRDYVLIYLLESGSDNGETPTIWYSEKDQPLIRKRYARCHDYNLLTELDRVTIPLRKWIVLNARILHGVDNITSKRVAFHVGLQDPFKLRGSFIE